MRIGVTVTTILLLATVLNVRGQSNASVSTQQAQISELARENAHLKEDLVRLGDDMARLKQVQTEDNLRSKERQNELADDFKEIEPFAKYWALFLGAILGVGTIWGSWTYFKSIPGLVKKEYETRIATLFTDQREKLIDILKEYDIEQQVKKNHGIILLTHKQGRDVYHHNTLEKWGFSVQSYTDVEKLDLAFSNSTVKPKHTDIIVINNEDGHWTPDEVRQFVLDNSNHFLYIGRNLIPLQGEALNRFAAASFRAQFIGNLMNILRYRN
jgi:hypothetical protein